MKNKTTSTSVSTSNLLYNISLDAGPVLRPSTFRLLNENKSSSNVPPTSPLKYRADLLLAFSYLFLDSQNEKHLQHKHYLELWRQVEPHLAFFNESQKRIRSISKNVPMTKASTVAAFEKRFMDGLHRALTPENFDLRELVSVLDTIHGLERDMQTPLLYNFSCHFSPDFVKHLQALECFLFHLRNLVAIDFNNHINDPSHEALRVDSVTDYLPKGDYVGSDAVLYWQIKKLTQPFVAGKRSDVRLEKLLIQPIENAFKKYAHNACHLIDHLPQSFLSAINSVDLEDTLYLVQMDWLLGSGTGLLFKIREELYGLQSGYEKVFWPELDSCPALKAASLTLNIEFSSQEILGHKKSA
jgi:hypothetical protein